MAIANQDTENALRSCLQSEGYSLSPVRTKGETGVDILATKCDEELHIEVIGFKKTGPSRSKDFYEAFFRAVSRLNLGATRIVIALPAQFRQGLNQRAAVYGPAWARLGAAFPELEIWLIQVSPPSYDRTTWCEWLTPNPALHLTGGAGQVSGSS